MAVLSPSTIALNGAMDTSSADDGHFIPAMPAMKTAIPPRQRASKDDRPMLNITGARNLSANRVRALVNRAGTRKWLPPLPTVFLCGEEHVWSDRSKMIKPTHVKHVKKPRVAIPKAAPKPKKVEPPKPPKPKKSPKKLWRKAIVHVEAIVEAKIRAARANEQNFFKMVEDAVNAANDQRSIDEEKDRLAMMRMLEEDEARRRAEEAAAAAEAERLRLLAAEAAERGQQEHSEGIKREWIGAKDNVVKAVKTTKVLKMTLKEKADREAAERRAQAERDRLEAARRKRDEQKAKRKSLRKMEPKAQVSQVTQYADMTANHDADKLKWYLHIWTVKLKHAEDEEVNLDQFKEALRVANRKLITDEEIQFCMSALDIVHDASHHEVPYNYKMFVTLASLADRVKSLEHIMVGHISKIDYGNAKGLEHKILEARKLFYLADGAKTTGMMSFEELEDICSAGGINGEVVDDIINQQMKDGSDGIDFLDFLSYLPLFIKVQEDIANNPLSFDHIPRRRSSMPGNFNEEDERRVRGQSRRFTLMSDGSDIPETVQNALPETVPEHSSGSDSEYESESESDGDVFD